MEKDNRINAYDRNEKRRGQYTQYIVGLNFI